MKLPILEVREEVVRAVRENQVVIVVGETGSGKTTQLPQFLYGAGFANGKKIGVTEPRRIAAISVAEFVAGELGTKLGTTVGYQVRFDDSTAEHTQIKFMTDGILLRELQLDSDLTKYSVIMVDEAHERSQNIDFVLGLLKDVLKRRKDLKVIVASATIDHEKFSRYFWDAPVVNVSGRMFPVVVKWSDHNHDWEQIPDAVVSTVEQIHRIGDDGDILVFMTGQDDVTKVIEGIEKCKLEGIITLPIYGALPPEEQGKIFKKYAGFRKVIVATNIAETSITVDGVVYVVDSGLVKQSNFHSGTGIQSLDIVAHSQAGCNQRAGRAGRTQPGICYRMYTKEDYEARPNFTEPEIRRTSLASVVLAMENIGLDEIETFDFVDPPEKAAFHEAYETLIALSAIKRGEKGLTEIGKAMARLPLEPRIARMLLEAEKHKCVSAVATVAAFLSVRTVFSRPREKEREANLAHLRFKNNSSDMLTYLAIWKAYEDAGYSSSWCFQNFLNGKSLREIEKVRTQLLQILRRSKIEISENGSEEQILKAIAAGLVYNLFRHASRHSYDGVVRTNCFDTYIHPSSAMFHAAPQWLVATEIVATSKVFARGCSRVEVGWLPELVPYHAGYGEGELTDVLPDRRGAKVQRDVLFDGSSVGYAELEVSLAEAHRIQDERVRGAQKKGWKRLTFEEDSSLSLWKFVAKEGDVEYKSNKWTGMRSGTYYCRIPDPYLMFGPKPTERKVYVDPQFQIFDLPPLIEASKESEEQEVEKPKPSIPEPLPKPVTKTPTAQPKVVSTSTLDVSELASKWGARVRA